ASSCSREGCTAPEKGQTRDVGASRSKPRQDYAIEAWADLGREDAGRGDLLERLEQLPLLVPFLQPQSLAIPVSVKARVLKMAALYDLPLTMQLLDEELLSRARQSLLVQDSFAAKLEEPKVPVPNYGAFGRSLTPSWLLNRLACCYKEAQAPSKNQLYLEY
ncbi:unnamed protein product, partial [Effrenium voratum]